MNKEMFFDGLRIVFRIQFYIQATFQISEKIANVAGRVEVA